MLRLFLGSFLSQTQQNAYAQIRESNQDLSDRWQCQVRWVGLDKLHMTWLFLGLVEESHVPKISQVISSLLEKTLPQAPLSLTYDRLEAWLVRGQPRHVVLTPSKPEEGFLALADKLRGALTAYVAPDSLAQASRELKPHLTLMRLSPLSAQLAHLPITHQAEEEHPLRGSKRLNSRLLDSSEIEGLVRFVPLIQNLDKLCLVESRSVAGSHQYVILKNFVLSAKERD